MKNENDFYVAIQGIMARYCEEHPEISGEELNDLMCEVVMEFIEENGMYELEGIDEEL